MDDRGWELLDDDATQAMLVDVDSTQPGQPEVPELGGGVLTEDVAGARIQGAECAAEVPATAEVEEPSRKRSRPSLRGPAGGDIRSFFASAAAAPAAGAPVGCAAAAAVVVPEPRPEAFAPAAQETPPAPPGADGVLSAFSLVRSMWQDLPEVDLEACVVAEQDGDLAVAALSKPVALMDAAEPVLILVASVPLLPSGRAIFKQLPAQWLELSGRSDALGTRCLFASRRHEHSVFAPLPPESLLRVPSSLHEWQPSLSVASSSSDAAQLAEEEPWSAQMKASRGAVRVVLRPGVLLHRMLRRGTALPAARFSWRVVDTSAGLHRGASRTELAPRPPGAAALGEFSILSNLEDAACTQPPNFAQYPLRREQLRSLGWMVAQERKRREPFVTELREEVPFPDAPHWRLEGSLRCEYVGVKGGVLADAIGYGKTACTIGLIDCTRKDPPPHVPDAFRGFIPTRATLVLAPTNLHAQWLAEITKFTGSTLKVLSVPTCSQLKRLTLRELMEADVVVATYRLFYSSPYLRRLSEVARTQRPDFSFPRLPGGVQGSSNGSAGARQEWARAYRAAFEAVPGWASQLPGQPKQEPVTPERSAVPAEADETPSPTQAPASQADARAPRRCRGKVPSSKSPLDTQATQAASQSGAKRRRLTGKQVVDAAEPEATQAYGTMQADAMAAAPEAESGAHYIPLEAFWWRRVVCDEFHELLSRYPPAQVAVELFHGDYKWGLSGTPPCQTLAQIRKAAGFLGVQLPSDAGSAATADDAREAPRQVAQEWLDAFVRRNTAELPPLDEEEQIVPVRQTPKEHALYLALTEHHTQAHEEAVVAAATQGAVVEEPPELQAARHSASGLLKLCSHFCASGASEVLTAEDECERQVAMRREQIRAAEREAKALAERAASTVQLVRHFEPHFCQAPVRANYGHICREPRAKIAERLKFLDAATSGTKPDLLKRLLGPEGAASKASEQLKDMALRADFNAKDSAPEPAQAPSWAKVEALATGAAVDGAGRQMIAKVVQEAVAAGCGKEGKAVAAPARCVRLRSNLGMPKLPGASAAAEAEVEFQEASWEWLASRDNAERLRNVTNAWKADIERCASRLLQLEGEAASKINRLKSFQNTLSASQAPQADVGPGAWEETNTPRFAKYGSKIQALVQHVQKIRAQDPGCKIICFVQWEDLKRKISSALEEFEVEHLTLRGSVWARRAALMKFQYEVDCEPMLLLSLEESASGTNLTAANHVIIVHPMEASTREEAVAFEMQAVGRVRRPGQERKIHIWRFVTMGTIEQQITEEHQRELWERQRATVLVTASQGQLEAISSDAAEQVCSDDEELPAAQQDAPLQPSMEAAFGASPGADLATQRYVPAEEAPEAAAPGGGAADEETLPFGGMPPPPDPNLLGAATQCFMDMGMATQRY